MFITRFIVHFSNLNPETVTSARPETRMYSSRGHAENRMNLTTEWTPQLVEVIAPDVAGCEEVLEEYK